MVEIKEGFRVLLVGGHGLVLGRMATVRGVIERKRMRLETLYAVELDDDVGIPQLCSTYDKTVLVPSKKGWWVLREHMDPL